jgi:hypothetical protein
MLLKILAGRFTVHLFPVDTQKVGGDERRLRNQLLEQTAQSSFDRVAFWPIEAEVNVGHKGGGILPQSIDDERAAGSSQPAAPSTLVIKREPEIGLPSTSSLVIT